MHPDFRSEAIPLIAALTANSFHQFVKFFWLSAYGDDYQDSRLTGILAEHLQAVAAGQITRLAMAIPVRHGKSSITQVMFPPWLWIRDPSLRIISSTYSYPLTERDAVKSRGVIQSRLYQDCFGHLYKLSDDQNRKDRYANDHLGTRLALSVGAATAGQDADLVLADDLNDYAGRKSEAELRTTRDYFWTTLTSRLVPGKDRVVLCGHRVSESDIFGDVYKTYGNDGTWTYLVLPAEGPAPIKYFNGLGWVDTRKEGELLCPERFPAQWYASERRKLRHDYNLQYQQDPSPSQGNLFHPDWLGEYDADTTHYTLAGKRYPKSSAWRFATSDLALSQSKGSDWTVMQVWDALGPHLLLVHQLRAKLDGTKIVPALAAVWREYRPDFIAVEQEFAGLMVIDQLRAKDVTIRKFRSKDHGDKETRSIPAQVKAEAGHIWLPPGKEWVPDFLREVTSFPNGAHDDQTDCLSMAAILAQRYGRDEVEEEQTEEEEQQARDEEQRRNFLRLLHAGL